MAVGSQWKKALKLGLSLIRPRFNSSKCKTMAKMAVARVKLLRNKREVVIRQMRRDIAMLLESGQDATARIRVEHVMREQNILAANELIELFCELVVARLSIIAKQSECPPDLKEGISSLLFAGPRCSDIPELLSLRSVFKKKYGDDFVSTATDLRPNAGVNRLLIEKLSIKTPSGESKLKFLKDIAKEYQVKWDATECESELLKPPEGRIDGPNNFTSASTMPINSVPKHTSEFSNATNGFQNQTTSFHDLAAAAGVAAEKALAAAEAAAFLADIEKKMPATYTNSLNQSASYSSSRNSADDWKNIKTKITSSQAGYQQDTEKVYRRQSYSCRRANTDIKFDESECEDDEDEVEEPRKFMRRHSYNVPPTRPDDSYAGDDTDLPPPAREAPGHRVHPRLPDYEDLAARFEALKHHKKDPKCY